MNLPSVPTPRPGWQTLLAVIVLLAILLAGTWWMYHPGLAGGFLFDDFANLPAIGATGPVDTWATFWRYITSGHADPTGRPLTLLSFLIDARNWPASPRPFLRTSLILHLINGGLLFVLLRQLGQAFVGGDDPDPRGAATIAPSFRRKPESIGRTGWMGKWIPAFAGMTRRTGAHGSVTRLAWRVDLAALVGAGLWLVHPLLVSTTLYIVQREAMLPATFVLIGLLLWLRGRARMLDGHTASGLAWMVLGLGGCTGLAILSKANGVLLPALALTIEYTVLRHPVTSAGSQDLKMDSGLRRNDEARSVSSQESKMDSGLRRDDEAGSVSSQESKMDSGLRRNDGGADAGVRRYRWALVVLAWLPAVLVAAYLVNRGWDGFLHGTGRRPWTMGQRLLTEPRVLLDYLQLLWIPRPFTPGLFNDQIHASVSLLAPWTTLPCLLAVLGLIVGALVMRKRWPAWALAVLFYFVGQALESSTIALELYFEHRNYLPAMLMFWALALWLCGVRQRTRGGARGAHALRKEHAGDDSEPGRSRTGCAPTGVGAEVSRLDADGSVHVRTGAGSGGPWLAVGKGVLAVALLAGLAVMTHARAGVWGNTREQALLWATLNPDSPRAQANAALAEMHAGQPARAANHLRALLNRDPSQVQLALNLFAAECSMGEVTPAAMQAAKTSLATTRNPGALLEHWFSRVIDQTAHPPCPQMTLDTVGALLAAAQSNPKLMAIGGRRQDLLVLRAQIALKRGQPDDALADFTQALDQNVRTSAALAMVAQLGSHGYPRRGLALLDHYETQARRHLAKPGFGMPRIHAWVLHREHYWQHELDRLRHTLQQDAAAKAAAR